MRNVRDDEQSVIASLLEQIEFHPQLLDLCGALTIRLLNLARILSLPLRSRDLVSRGVLFAPQSFQLREQPSATRLERGKLLERARHVDAAIGKCGSDGFEIVSEKGGIDHVRARVHIVQHPVSPKRMSKLNTRRRAAIRSAPWLAPFARQSFPLRVSAHGSSPPPRRSRKRCSCS